MTITVFETALLVWFAVSSIVGLLIGPLFDHKLCGCLPRNLQRARVSPISDS
jgi:hypothetical protein